MKKQRLAGLNSKMSISVIFAQKALDQGKADRLLYLKGDTKGGRAGKIDTVPLYMLERYSFDESSV